jgi:disulfide bond formation protein DsbB
MAIMTLTNQLKYIAHSRWYWLIYIIGSISLIAIALYFQYARDELPCVMCIQIRLWFSLLIIVSFIGLLARRIRAINTLVQVSIVLIAVGLVERSYKLLGTERGFWDGHCGFDLGLPAWFAIDKWLPWLFRVETTCSYTPEILFGITMAETLMVMSVVLLLVSVCVLLLYMVSPLSKR